MQCVWVPISVHSFSHSFTEDNYILSGKYKYDVICTPGGWGKRNRQVSFSVPAVIHWRWVSRALWGHWLASGKEELSRDYWNPSRKQEGGRWHILRIETMPLTPIICWIPREYRQSTVWRAFKPSPAALPGTYKWSERWLVKPWRAHGSRSPGLSLSWSSFKWHKGPGSVNTFACAYLWLKRLLLCHCTARAAQPGDDRLRFGNQLSGLHTGSAIS